MISAKDGRYVAYDMTENDINRVGGITGRDLKRSQWNPQKNFRKDKNAIAEFKSASKAVKSGTTTAHRQ